MEVFTVSVGIGRVAISVRQTRQVVSRLHAEIYHELGSMPIIISVLRYQGSRRYVAVPGGFPPSAHTCMGHCYLSFPVMPISRGPDALKTSVPARTLPDSLSPYQGMLFKPFGLVDPLNFEGSDGASDLCPPRQVARISRPSARRANSPNTSQVFKRCGMVAGQDEGNPPISTSIINTNRETQPRI
jgi:hypothetical protein